MPVLADEDNVAVLKQRDYADRARMHDDLQFGRVSCGVNDPVDTNLDVPALEYEFAVDKLRFCHQPSASTSRSARTVLSICLGVMMKGGKNRRAVSCVQLIMNPRSSIFLT